MTIANRAGSGRGHNKRVLDRRWLRAYGLFTGGVIGVGVFGLPAALVAAGLPLFLLQLSVVALLAWWIHRCYASVVLATAGRHRLPGYVRLVLGRWGFALVSVTSIFGFIGALVAYLIAGGTYLRLLLEPGIAIPQWLATGIYLLPGALLLVWGLRALPAVELLILGLFLLVLLVLPLVAGPEANLLQVPLAPAGFSGALLPYGVLLFAFWGISLIPETAELSERNERRTQSVLAAGLLTAMISYMIFAVLIAAVTGSQTSEDALSGLRAVLGDGVVTLTLIFGLLTTFSSYLALGLTLQRTLELDLHVPRAAAAVSAVVIPLAFLALGARSLLAVLSFTGAIFLGVEGLAVVAMRRSTATSTERVTRPLLRTALLVSGVLLVIGVVAEVARQTVV